MFEIFKGHTHHCQHNTWLKWERDGALSAEDRTSLMAVRCKANPHTCCLQTIDVSSDARSLHPDSYLP